MRALSCGGCAPTPHPGRARCAALAHPPALGFSFLCGGFAPTPPLGSRARMSRWSRRPAPSPRWERVGVRGAPSPAGAAPPRPPPGRCALPPAPSPLAGEGGGEGVRRPPDDKPSTPHPTPEGGPAPSPLAGEGGGEGERAQPATEQAPAGEPRSPPGTTPRLATQPRDPEWIVEGGCGGEPPLEKTAPSPLAGEGGGEGVRRSPDDKPSRAHEQRRGGVGGAPPHQKHCGRGRGDRRGTPELQGRTAFRDEQRRASPLTPTLSPRRGGRIRGRPRASRRRPASRERGPRGPSPPPSPSEGAGGGALGARGPGGALTPTLSLGARGPEQPSPPPSPSGRAPSPPPSPSGRGGRRGRPHPHPLPRGEGAGGERPHPHPLPQERGPDSRAPSPPPLPRGEGAGGERPHPHPLACGGGAPAARERPHPHPLPRGEGGGALTPALSPGGCGGEPALRQPSPPLGTTEGKRMGPRCRGPTCNQQWRRACPRGAGCRFG